MILTMSTMNSDEIKAEYASSLADLTFNSKPLINVLTMLADENSQHASVIVAAIEHHLAKVHTDVKLPILYLVDCIVKNIGEDYVRLFSQNIVNTFCSVFKVVDEKTRAEMFKLRQTWNEIFPQKKLYAIDIQINMLDPAWPVTAQAPPNSIHFNPKFLKQGKSKPEATPSVPEVVATADNETFAMQQKLIQKQKELIELQQKKLELELLQTQVKLQKQMKGNPKAMAPGNLPVRPQNILLKPEVAKQLIPIPREGVKGLGLRGQTSAIPRIARVNSALIAAAAARPTRDPRLLRQQTEKPSNSSSSVSLGSKTAILDSNNKVVTSTKGLRDIRTEARLVNNKDNNNVPPSPSKSKTSPKSIREQKLAKIARSKNNSDSDSKSLPSSKSSSSTSLDSPTKNKGEMAKSPIKSPGGKHKKKREGKRERKIDSSLPGFKGVKEKNRNYIRRNRSPSFSPEPTSHDVDLRVSAPPEKQARLIGDPEEDKTKSVLPSTAPTNGNFFNGLSLAAGKVVGGGDVDLRQLPAAVTKKRPSTEAAEHTSKKSKSEVFDVLFGNEDTDLRTVLPVVQPDRPPTPPPPIISLADKDSPKKASNLDAVRAKLANATGRDKVLAKCFRKKKVQDEDLRVANDSMKKIIISSDDEQCIKAGTMTKEQEKQLMNKIIAQIEHQKLKEAQEKDKEESLQPVSDEELDFGEENDGKFGDKDDRVPFTKFAREPREVRRGGNFWRGAKRRHWENPHPGPHPRPALRPRVHPINPWRPIGPNFNPPEFLDVDSANKDDIKTINIDGAPREIKYYDETAIIFMDWDDPREISFQNGSRRVIFGDQEIYVLSFGEGYQELSINGMMHRVRLGAPSREIFIDGKPYECYFGGPPITIDLNGQMTMVKLDGPPPQVKIGQVKRTDLVAGKVSLIIDAKILVPVFLDAKLQKFVIEGETHSLKFVDALKTVLINDVPFKVEFGGLPKPITVHDKKHFVRFSVLPRGIKPGHVSIKDMEGTPPVDEENQEPHPNVDVNEQVAPAVGAKRNEEEQDSNSPHFFQHIMNQNNLDMLSSVMTSSVAPSSNTGGYQVENAPPIDNQTVDSAPPLNKSIKIPPTAVNINELFQKLVATGIVATKEPIEEPPPEPAPPPRRRRHPLEHLRPVSFNRPETLKIRQHSLYDVLHSGIQCSSCGMRFPPEQSMLYSQHLDWHFRQNRKGKKNIRVASSRRWYYSFSDWKNYEEIEDLEEREKNYFDQKSLAEGAAEDAEEEVEIPSVPADPDVQEAHCEVCQDKFDHFFNEEKEEWHLRNAIRVDDKTYHPLCYEDYQNSLLQPMEDSTKPEEPEETIDKTEEQNIPGLEIILDDDDEEEEEEQKSDREVIIEDDEDSKIEDAKEEEQQEEDDDVIINEIVPERIEVDDDREYLDNNSVDYTVKVEQPDDGFMDVEEGLITMKNGHQITIKSEPVDPDLDELPVTEVPEEEPPSYTDAVQPVLISSSIDGNTEPLSSIPTTTPSIIGGKIKINISKPLPVITSKEPKEISCDSAPSLDPVIDPSQPLPPGEEPVQLNIKPALRGVELKKLPPVQKGSELTGMCSIM